MTADDLFGASLPLRAGHRSRERACEWLRQFLAKGPRRAPEVFEEARKAGIPERTLYRVKATVGVVSEAKKFADRVEWWWSDPAGDRARGAGNGLAPLAESDWMDELPPLDPLDPLDDDPPTGASVERLIRAMNRATRASRASRADDG